MHQIVRHGCERQEEKGGRGLGVRHLLQLPSCSPFLLHIGFVGVYSGNVIRLQFSYKHGGFSAHVGAGLAISKRVFWYVTGVFLPQNGLFFGTKLGVFR